MRRVPLLKKVLQEVGINPDRVLFEFISASEGAKYAATVDKFTDYIRKLGPLQLQKPELEAVGHSAEEGH